MAFWGWKCRNNELLVEHDAKRVNKVCSPQKLEYVYEGGPGAQGVEGWLGSLHPPFFRIMHNNILVFFLIFDTHWCKKKVVTCVEKMVMNSQLVMYEFFFF